MLEYIVCTVLGKNYAFLDIFLSSEANQLVIKMYVFFFGGGGVCLGHVKYCSFTPSLSLVMKGIILHSHGVHRNQNQTLFIMSLGILTEVFSKLL